METSRVEAFSDGVFAIALTVLVLTIEAPDPRGDLARELVRLWPSYLPYALTVLVIGAVRVNHHAMIETHRGGGLADAVHEHDHARKAPP